MAGDSSEPFDNTQEQESDLDPRIQIELEALNNATDDINKLEMELDESNTTFRILHNESTRRLKLLNKQLGSCIERARPYYEALEIAKQAQLECQKAAVKFQRANEIHQAAKETVALAEARFLSKQHEWEFDSAWQDMLKNAIIKVTDAENQKSESGREHHKKATLFTAAETKVQLLEHRLKRAIVKSRPYFEEKALCEGQLSTQKARVLQLREAVKGAKARYAASLRRLEDISEEIHMRRRRESLCESPTGPREPGVGAELTTFPHSDTHSLDVDFDLDKCDVTSMSSSVTNGSRYDSGDEGSSSGLNAEDLDKLRIRVRELAATPVDWHSEAPDNNTERLTECSMSRDAGENSVTSPCHSQASSNPTPTPSYNPTPTPTHNFTLSTTHFPIATPNHRPQIDIPSVSSTNNSNHEIPNHKSSSGKPSATHTHISNKEIILSPVKQVPTSSHHMNHITNNVKYDHGEPSSSPLKDKHFSSSVDTSRHMFHVSSSDKTSNSCSLQKPSVSSPIDKFSKCSTVCPSEDNSFASSSQKASLNNTPIEKSTSSSIQTMSSSICKKLQNTIDHPLRSLVDSTARSFTSK